MSLIAVVDCLLSLFQVEGQSIEYPIIVFGGKTIILLCCMLTICVAIHNTLVSCTGRKKRKRWTRAENVKVMECYYKSKLSKDLGYMQRMLDLWINEGMEVLPKKRLADQARSILKNKLLSEDELKEIRDRVGFQEEDRCVIC